MSSVLVPVETVVSKLMTDMKRVATFKSLLNATATWHPLYKHKEMTDLLFSSMSHVVYYCSYLLEVATVSKLMTEINDVAAVKSLLHATSTNTKE